MSEKQLESNKLDKIISDLRQKITESQQVIKDFESGSDSQLFAHQKLDRLQETVVDEISSTNYSELLHFEDKCPNIKLKAIRNSLVKKVTESNNQVIKLELELKNLRQEKLNLIEPHNTVKDVKKLLDFEEKYLDEMATMMINDFYKSPTLKILMKVRDLIYAYMGDESKNPYLDMKEYNIEDINLLHKVRIVEFSMDSQFIKLIDFYE